MRLTASNVVQYAFATLVKSNICVLSVVDGCETFAWSALGIDRCSHKQIQCVRSRDRGVDPLVNAIGLDNWMNGRLRRKPNHIANAEDSPTPCFQRAGTPQLAILVGFDIDRRQIEVLREADGSAAIHNISMRVGKDSGRLPESEF